MKNAIYILTIILCFACENHDKKIEKLETIIKEKTEEVRQIEKQEREDFSKPKPQYKVENGRFYGAWFSVWFPQDFEIIPSMTSSSSDGYDSVKFLSSDGLVEFYVYSPQWNGEATDIVLNPNSEKITSKDTKSQGNQTITWITISAKDRSYQRSYQITENKSSNTSYTIGLKYAHQTAYNQYKPQYLQFKKSLEQYAD